ncbi:Acyl-CoA-binding- like protein [Cyphellophora attinorum]|uniref:Acyl-CoA-binding-like protein n=1 Tax=Cyphellophora attinorum TaxID=1664694 RepID=A0A0N1P149_9EURO|nr:Acyl-CoA-binding- like protein [Phialophora attinorum]KPI43815.1 Acyl-CoA-binding- like protein [Phialophora attinorum]
MTGAQFQEAVKASRQLKAKPSNDELLELYALFKVANGEDISKSTAPGMFDLSTLHPSTHTSPPSLTGNKPTDTRAEGKAKQKAWQKEVDAKTTPADAEKRYVALVEQLKKTHGYDPSKPAEAVGGS